MNDILEFNSIPKSSARGDDGILKVDASEADAEIGGGRG
jgi:hypothetical protein